MPKKKKKYSYWLISKSKRTGEKKWAVGKWGPEIYVQGSESKVKKIVDCFNNKKCKIYLQKTIGRVNDDMKLKKGKRKPSAFNR